MHSNNKWVNSAQGIVGVSGSSPHANPVVGNPRGIGIQLAHNGGPHGTGPVYISRNMGDPNKQIYVRAPWQGTCFSTGVTHSIQLRARVIRTSPPSNPIITGPFNSSVIVVIQYP